MKLEKVAELIATKLLEQGFIIHRYDAFSTNSIYLKLDYGACNSIRISDHYGYEHLSYKYNIISGITNKGWYKDKNDKWKYMCSTSNKSVDELIAMILSDKIYKKTHYNYAEEMEKYKNNRNTDISFWRECKELKL